MIGAENANAREWGRRWFISQVTLKRVPEDLCNRHPALRSSPPRAFQEPFIGLNHDPLHAIMIASTTTRAFAADATMFAFTMRSACSPAR